MSIFYEDNEKIKIGGDYDQEKSDFTHPNHENNYSDDHLYDEFNKLGDSYVKIKEHTSIFHDLEIVEEESVEKDEKNGLSDKIKKKIFTGKKSGAEKFDKPLSRKEAFGDKKSTTKSAKHESFSFLDGNII